MNCMVSIKELYRPLNRESFHHEPRRSHVASRISFREKKSVELKPSKKKKPTKVVPGLIIQMWRSNNEEEIRPKPSSLTPELKKRPYSSVFIKKSSFISRGIGALEGLRIKHNSFCIGSCEIRPRLKKRRTLKAVLPKVEHLKGWGS